MELAHIVEADYVTVPLDTVALDAAAASVKSEQQLAELLHNLKIKCARRRRNSNSRRLRSSATASNR